MLYFFPEDTFAVARLAYVRPYDDPISVREGGIVQPHTDGAMKTDFIGWTWCTAVDGRSGWTPDNWCDVVKGGLRLTRDFSALEHTVEIGDKLRLILSESGFVFAERDDGTRAWIPDAILTSVENL